MTDAFLRDNISFLIVVPTYNSFRSLPVLATSLYNQTFKDWRVIFIDGPSSVEHRNWLIDCCNNDSRFTWEIQSDFTGKIFGAMNQGFANANNREWVLFWGSDDWAASSTVFEELVEKIILPSSLSSKRVLPPDIIVCSSRYFNVKKHSLGRKSSFKNESVLSSKSFRQALRFGSTPPHQSTIFAPNTRNLLSSFSTSFRLCADLDYFLRLSCFPNISVQCLSLELVHMADGGISGQQPQHRLHEVLRAYRNAFPAGWLLPFMIRYFRRILSYFL
ncbi:glycosyltransferase [bacterium]|nr:glycosyltransferase [bacterium]